LGEGEVFVGPSLGLGKGLLHRSHLLRVLWAHPQQQPPHATPDKQAKKRSHGDTVSTEGVGGGHGVRGNPTWSFLRLASVCFALLSSLQLDHDLIQEELLALGACLAHTIPDGAKKTRHAFHAAQTPVLQEIKP
jgi:hypothetical protein